MIPWKTSFIPLALCFVALVVAFATGGWGNVLFVALLLLLVFLVDLCVSLSRKNKAQRATGRAKGSRTDADDSSVAVLAVAAVDVANDGKDSSGGFWSSVGDFFSSDSSGGGGYSGGDSGGGDGGGGGGGGD